MSWGKHKDWTTTMREARTRSVPANLPSHLKEYFNKSMKAEKSHSRPCSSSDNPHGSTYQAENGRVRDRRREALLHVSRNNPHPFRIHFPFQTGDRLSTYMVWLPMDRSIDNTPSLPKIRHNAANKSRALPIGNTSGANKKLYEKYNNPSTPLSTYQAEIASIPLLKHRVMADHFPSLSKGRSLVYAGH